MKRNAIMFCFLVLILTLCAQRETLAETGDEFDFGIVSYLKNYPTYKKGIHPYSALSGKITENVDLYSGKLNLTVPLPGIPFNNSDSFAPVLTYNSNLWIYRMPRLSSLTLGGELKSDDRTDPPYWGLIPDYWGNDSWIRFSPIGQPHNMPGWTLTIGGVYTEYVQGNQPIGNTLIRCNPECLYLDEFIYPIMEKKCFVAPDGSTHIMVDTKTNGRPYFIDHSIEYFDDDPLPDEPLPICVTDFDNFSEDFCMPHRGFSTGELRVWRTVDGSHYYYIEGTASNADKVYAGDGTTYVLWPTNTAHPEYSADKAGMIRQIIHRDGDSIEITTAQTSQGGRDFVVYTYSSSYGSWMEIWFERITLAHYISQDDSNTPITCHLLSSLRHPAADGQEMIYEFRYRRLVEHLRGYQPPAGEQVFFSDIIHDPILEYLVNGQPYTKDFGAKVFARDDEPNDMDKFQNRVIFVLEEIKFPAPEDRRLRFKYNRAGKISQVTYPDGGFRRYEYGNTKDVDAPRAILTEEFHGWNGRYRGECPFGRVSLVYQGLNPADPGAAVLERAYVYSGRDEISTPDGERYTEVITWTADEALQRHRFYASETAESQRSKRLITQFGFPRWQTGKLRQTRQYGYSNWYSANSSEFIRKILGLSAYVDFGEEVIPEIQDYTDMKLNLQIDALKLFQEEENSYTNYNSGWQWALPTGFCTTCYSSGATQPDISALYSYVIPVNPQGDDMFFPGWNTFINEKRIRVYDDSGQYMTKRTRYHYRHAYSNDLSMMEAYASPDFEVIYDWDYSDSSIDAERLTHNQFIDYWPNPASLPADMPGRVLGLPKETTVRRVTNPDQPFTASGELLASTKQTYVSENPGSFCNRSQLYPIQVSNLKFPSQVGSEGAWTKSRFTYQNYSRTGQDRNVRLLKIENYDCSESCSTIKSTVLYDYTDDLPGIFKKAEIRNGTETGALIQYSLMDYDPATGLLIKRTDRNGDLNANQIIDSTDNYILFRYDLANRPTTVSLMENGLEKRMAEFGFQLATDGTSQVTRTDYFTNDYVMGVTKTTIVRNDPLGRNVFSWSTIGEEAGEEIMSFVRKDFDTLGRVIKEYFPVSQTANALNTKANDTWIQHSYDELGRVIESRKPGLSGSKSFVSSRVFYDVDILKERTTQQVEDETGRYRLLYYDGIERLCEVFEPDPDPGDGVTQTLWTQYVYDGLDNLVEVHKLGADGVSDPQPRSFTYDALGRLTTAQLPEYNQNVMQYVHDDFGNLVEKHMGAFYQENMDYDGLGRLISRHVDGPYGTMHNYFQYDTTNLSGPDGFSSGDYTWGRLVRDQAQFDFDDDQVMVERFFRYNHRGLMSRKTESFSQGVAPDQVVRSFSTHYDLYNLAGNLLEMTYPSGQKMTYDYQAGGVLLDLGVNNHPLVTGMSYHPSGALSDMTLHGRDGGTVTWVQTLNSRQWPQKIMVGTGTTPDAFPADQLFGLWYPDEGYEANGNIGTIWRYWRTETGAETRYARFDYQYDELNRLRSFELQDFYRAFERRFDYLMDEFGNVTGRDQFTLAGVPVGVSIDLPVSTTTNRLTGRSYDTLGNLVQLGPDNDVGAQGMVFWDQGHGARFTDSGTGEIYWYFYDAGGKRRIKAVELNGDVDLDGDVSFFFYEGEDLICQLDCGTEIQEPLAYEARFLLQDHLGTTRAEMRFEPAGAGYEPVLTAEYDYMPYGDILDEWHAGGDPPGEQVLFTGKQRDDESDLDYFGARFFCNSFLRWMSPDGIFLDNKIDNPSTWNLYYYARNNPKVNIDLTGTTVVWVERDSNGRDTGVRAVRTKFFKRMINLLESKDEADKAKGVRMLMSYLEAESAQEIFFVHREKSGGNSSGITEYWGTPGELHINLLGDTSFDVALTHVQKLAHEFMHCCQFLDGKFGYLYNEETGKWDAYRLDAVDEAEAFIAGFEAEPIVTAQQKSEFLRAINQAMLGGVNDVVNAIKGKDAPNKYRRLVPFQLRITQIGEKVYAKKN